MIFLTFQCPCLLLTNGGVYPSYEKLANSFYLRAISHGFDQQHAMN
jgi:hypothetical protein